MERKIDSTFTYKDMDENLIVKLRVVKSNPFKNCCFGYFFWEKLYPRCGSIASLGSCRRLLRADQTDIVFKEVKEQTIA